MKSLPLLFFSACISFQQVNAVAPLTDAKGTFGLLDPADCSDDASVLLLSGLEAPTNCDCSCSGVTTCEISISRSTSFACTNAIESPVTFSSLGAVCSDNPGTAVQPAGLFIGEPSLPTGGCVNTGTGELAPLRWRENRVFCKAAGGNCRLQATGPCADDYPVDEGSYYTAVDDQRACVCDACTATGEAHCPTSLSLSLSVAKDCAGQAPVSSTEVSTGVANTCLSNSGGTRWGAFNAYVVTGSDWVVPTCTRHVEVSGTAAPTGDVHVCCQRR